MPPRTVPALAALAVTAFLAPAPSKAGEAATDLGLMRLRMPAGAIAEVRFKDRLGMRLDSTGPMPAGTASVTVDFQRGASPCPQAACGDARALPAVGWGPALPFLFAIEAGPPRIAPPRTLPRQGRGDFLPVPGRPGTWASNPRRMRFPQGERALARCAGGSCTVQVPLRPGVRGWFVCDDPREAGAATLAVAEFGRWAVPADRGCRH